MIFIFDGTIIFVFLFFAAALGYTALEALHGVIATIAVITFIVEVIVALYYTKRMIKNKKKYYRSTSSKDVFMVLLSSALCLFTSYLFLNDISNYGTGLGEMIYFVVALLVCGVPWIYVVEGWIEAVKEESFNYEGLTKEVFASAVILFIFFVL